MYGARFDSSLPERSACREVGRDSGIFARHSLYEKHPRRLPEGVLGSAREGGRCSGGASGLAGNGVFGHEYHQVPAENHKVTDLLMRRCLQLDR